VCVPLVRAGVKGTFFDKYRRDTAVIEKKRIRKRVFVFRFRGETLKKKGMVLEVVLVEKKKI